MSCKMKIIGIIICFVSILGANSQIDYNMICHIVDQVLVFLMCIDRESGQDIYGQLSKCLGGPLETTMEEQCADGVLSGKARDCFMSVKTLESMDNSITTKCAQELVSTLNSS